MQSSITEHCSICHRLMSLKDIRLNDRDEWICKPGNECQEGITTNNQNQNKSANPLADADGGGKLPHGNPPESNLSEKLAVLEVENKRLREALVGLAEVGCNSERDGFCRENESDISEYCYPCQANEALPPNTQPTPTTGILELAAAGYRLYLDILKTPKPADCEELLCTADSLSPEVKAILNSISPKQENPNA